MASYVIRRNEDGAFVAPPGSKKSYVKDVRKARIFTDLKTPSSEVCGNETVLTLESVLG